MVNKNFLSVRELADLLGISRIAVFKKIKKGQIKATKIGKNYVIEVKNLAKNNTSSEKKSLTKAVKKVVKEYGETLKLLGNE